MTTASPVTGLRSEINMTPMIDVLLVLLVIFMVLTPVTTKGLPALVPQPPDSLTPNQAQANDVVVTVCRDLAILLNQDAVSRAELPARLAGIFRLRPHGALFVRGDKDLPYGAVADVIDQAKGAGVSRIGLMGSY